MTPIQKEGYHAGNRKEISGLGAGAAGTGNYGKKKGDTCYLYKRTSRRFPGKKYPQPVDTYIGIIMPEGVIKSEKKKYPLAGSR